MRTRILLADDHVVLREAIRELLEGRGGFEVVAEAGDGEEAVALARMHRPDLAVIDLGMPVLDGDAAIRHILEAVPTCRILVLSMYEDWGHVQAALQAGASAYLVKSAAADDLLRAIDLVRSGRAYVSPQVAGSMLDRIRGDAPREESPLARLTGRERDVLRLVAEGQTSKEVARSLGVAVKTVDAHRASLMRKLEVHKASELVRLAVREGLIRP